MQLYDHQQKIIDADPKKCGLFLGTGSGKTATALLLARNLTLVICPKTQKEDKNWERQLHRLDGARPISLTVMSKEEFRRDHETLPHFDTVIVDEAHTCLGATPNIRYVQKIPRPKTSQVFEALQEFLEMTKPERLYLVTATPIRNPMTVWAAGTLLGKKWDFYKWRDAFYMRIPMPGREVHIPKKGEMIKERIAAAVNKIGYTGRLSDYFDVPDQVYKKIYLEPTLIQKKRIAELKVEYPDPLVIIGKRHQVENGVLSGNEFSPLELFDSPKIDALLDLALEFPRMIVFAKYTAQIKQIEHSMVKAGYNVLKLTGATTDRGELLARANGMKEYIFIAQAQVSAGWELPECPVMVFASLDWSYVNYSQGVGRILRVNHLKKNLYIHLIMKGGIDENVYNSIMNKQDFNEKIYSQKINSVS